MENNHMTENLKAHFLRLYQMAICDDDFSTLELKMLYQCAEERGISSKHLDNILSNPINIKTVIPQNIEEKVDYLYDLTVMIWADGEVSPDEYSTMEKYVLMFGFLEENVKAIVDYLIEAVKIGKNKNEILQELKKIMNQY
jgi:DnaJ-domain-containing protein 1